jgi:hypothetical protein
LASRQHHLARIGTAIACAAWFAHGVSLAQSPPAPAGESRSNQLNIQRVVFGAFPEADAYRGIKRSVSQPHRRAIEKKLPFKVHFNELGEHELLVAFRGRRPVGVVYCRTEEADWGLAVIAWHISLDQRIVGFEFLRGRNRNIKDLEQSQIATDLRGCSFAQIAQLTTHMTDRTTANAILVWSRSSAPPCALRPRSWRSSASSGKPRSKR